MIKKLLFLCVFMAASLSAHQTALSYLELNIDNDMRIEVIVKKPLQDMNSDDLKIAFPRSCHDVLPASKFANERFFILKRSLWCGENGLDGEAIWIRNLLESDKGVVFRYESDDAKIENRLITAYEPYVLIEKNIDQKSSFAYLWLGVEHILLGIDHLLFVLALLLLVTNIKVLVQTITAFTVAHSITLGLAILGFLQFSVPYVETMIALSIIFLARELLITSEKKTLSHTHPWIIAFVFGLLHGLGFATVLFDVGLAPEHIVSSLLFFNLGVELGQLMFIAVVLGIIWIFKKITTKYGELVRKTTLYSIGIVAAYWFIERSLLFFNQIIHI